MKLESSFIKYGNDDFYIESYVDSYIYDKSKMALGYFVICIKNKLFGVYESDATLLSCSYNEVVTRISNRNKHILSFGTKYDSHSLSKATLMAYIGEDEDSSLMPILEYIEFKNILFTNNILWAPDGDEAFDDGSYIIQMDYGDQVRIIGFKNEGGMENFLDSIVELWIDSDTFYGILKDWSDRFLSQWRSNAESDNQELR